MHSRIIRNLRYSKDVSHDQQAKFGKNRSNFGNKQVVGLYNFEAAIREGDRRNYHFATVEVHATSI